MNIFFIIAAVLAAATFGFHCWAVRIADNPDDHRSMCFQAQMEALCLMFSIIFLMVGAMS